MCLGMSEVGLRCHCSGAVGHLVFSLAKFIQCWWTSEPQRLPFWPPTRMILYFSIIVRSLQALEEQTQVLVLSFTLTFGFKLYCLQSL